MQQLSSYQHKTIAEALDGLRIAYNRFDAEQCRFAGIPDDLSSLDLIPYELPIAEAFAEGSTPFAAAWGNVLTESFGFAWTCENDCDDIRMFSLVHDEPTVLIFPYFRLIEITRSSGSQDSPAATLWFETIRYFDQRSVVPDGWHPVFDAINCPRTIGCPKSLTTACRRLVDVYPEFYFTMSTYPYRWTRDQNWDAFRNYVEQLATVHQR